MRKRSSTRALLYTFVVAAALLVLGGDVRSEDFAYPEGRVGEVAKAFVTAFSSGDEDVATKFYNTYLSAEAMEEHPLKDQLWRYQHMYNLLGAITPQSIVSHEGASLVLLVESETLQSFFHVGIELNSATPPLLIDAYIRPAPRPK